MSGKYELIRSLVKDNPEPVECKVIGEIPEWLNGSLFRNGPGRFEYGEKTYNHLFDGHSCVHKFTISDGKVTFSNKILDTVSYRKTVKNNRLYPVFGTSDVCSNVFGRLKTFYNTLEDEKLDNVNVNVVPYGKLNKSF